MVVNVFAVCYAISYPVVGWLVDRLGPGHDARWGSSPGRWLHRRGLDADARPVHCLPRHARPGRADGVSGPVARGGHLVSRHAAGDGQQLCVAGSSIGAIAAPPLVACWRCISTGMWPSSFPGLLGLAIAAVWWLIYRDPPPEMASELDLGALGSPAQASPGRSSGGPAACGASSFAGSSATRSGTSACSGCRAISRRIPACRWPRSAWSVGFPFWRPTWGDRQFGLVRLAGAGAGSSRCGPERSCSRPGRAGAGVHVDAVPWASGPRADRFQHRRPWCA